jgi:hypothetical protein
MEGPALAQTLPVSCGLSPSAETVTETTPQSGQYTARRNASFDPPRTQVQRPSGTKWQNAFDTAAVPRKQPFIWDILRQLGGLL